jgi:tetratricopeptide (TPR) repeat protein
VCLKAMALKQDRRHASPRALADDIEHWLADEPVSAWPEPWTVKTGRWMRRHKPLVSGVAASFLVGIVGLTAGLVWYQSEQNRRASEQALRQAEAARKLALTVQSVRQGLDQARETRNKLHAALKKAGGVQELLNQPARWEVQIKTARADWQRAKALAANAEESLDPDLLDLLQKLENELARDKADFEFARRLERIRLDTAVWVEGKFNYAQAEKEYPQAFADFKLAMEPGQQKETARLIQESAIRDQLLAAMDDWAWVAYVRKKPDLDLCSRLLVVARLADPDPWRDQVRDLALWENPVDIVKLADAVQKDPTTLARLSPQMLVLISHLLPDGKREPWLRKAQSVHPADFWLNFGLASVLARNKAKAPEASGFYRVALAIRPKTPAVYTNLGLAFYDQKDLPAAVDAHKKALAIDDKIAPVWYNLGIALADQKDLPAAIDAYKKALAIDAKFAPAWNGLGTARQDQKDLRAAIDAYKKALAIDSKFAMAWYNLGHALDEQNDLPGAIDAYKKALAIDAKFAMAWNNLGITLANQKDLPAAIDAYKKALDIDAKYAPTWYNLGIALYDQKDLPAAIDAYKKALALDAKLAKAWNNLGMALGDQKDLPAAIDAFTKVINLDPHDAGAHCNLGNVYRLQGDFAGALKAFQKGHELGSRQPGWHNPSAAWVKQCQQLLALEQRLPGVMQGEAVSAGDLLALADLCQRYKKRYRDSAALFAKAFASEPKQAENLDNGYRYNAACAAALAAAGKGAGAEKLEAKEKTSLRQQTLAWLQADVDARSRFLEKNPFLAVRIQDDMQHWKADSDLAGVRDEQEIAKLPAEERAAWQKFWGEVDSLSKQARASYTQTEHKGQLSAKVAEQRHPIKMTASKTYVIDMESPQFDTYLRLEDDKGKVLAENDDISPQNLNSRIIFTAPKDGTYRIVATSFEHRGSGAYTLTIREFTPKKAK